MPKLFYQQPFLLSLNKILILGKILRTGMEEAIADNE